MSQNDDRFRVSREVGERLRRLRIRARLTQAQLADATGRGWANTMVSRLESGGYPNPGIAVIADYLRACRASFEDILDILNEYTSRPTPAEEKARKAVVEVVSQLPVEIGTQALKYDVKTTVARRAEGKPPLSSKERVKRVVNLAAAANRRRRLDILVKYLEEEVGHGLVLTERQFLQRLVRTDTLGDTLWTRCYGQSTDDVASSLCIAPDGGVVVAGATSSFIDDSSRFYLIRTDAVGDTVWTRTYAGFEYAMCNSVCPSVGGGYVLAGIVWLDSGTGAWLACVNDDGDTLWTRTLVRSDGASADGIQPVAGGGYVVSGQVIAGTDWDMLLMRVNDSGETLWTRTFGGTGRESGYGVRQTLDSGFIVVGHTDSYGAGGSDVYVIRTDANGETLWTRTFGGPGDDRGWSVETTTDGGFAIAAQLIDSGLCLIRLDSSGAPLWTRGYGGGGAMVAYDLGETSDRGFILTGEVSSDLALVKTDSVGNAVGLEENRRLQAPSRKPAATVVRSLPPGTLAFDAMGRRVANPRSGIYFLGEGLGARGQGLGRMLKVVLQR